MPVYGSIGEFLQATIALIAIANPIAALPNLLVAGRGRRPGARRAAANRVSLAMLAILARAVLIGRFVLELFGVSFTAFRVGGGLVVTLTGLDMLRRRDPLPEEDAATAPARPTSSSSPWRCRSLPDRAPSSRPWR